MLTINDYLESESKAFERISLIKWGLLTYQFRSNACNSFIDNDFLYQWSGIFSDGFY